MTGSDEERLLTIATTARTRAALAGLLRPRRLAATIALLVLVAGTVVGLATAPLLGHIVDTVAGGGKNLVWPVVALILVAIVQGVSASIGTGRVARVGEAMLADLRERFVERALHLPLDRVERAGAGDLTSRVTRDVQVVSDAVRTAAPVLARSMLTIVLTIGAIAVLDWRFLLPVLLALPIHLHTVRWYGGTAVRLYAKQRVAVGAQQQQLLESIGGAATVRAFGLADTHVERVRKRSATAVDLALQGIGLLTRFYGRLNLAEFIGLAGVLATGFWLVGTGGATLGTATAAALYFHSLFNPLNAALALADDAQAATASLSRLVGVVDEPVEKPADRVVVDPTVEVAGVGHAYVDGHPVLRDVDLELAPGERVALVGASGAGKTTLAKLIAGVHRPTTGAITLGGVPLAEAARSVALITQEVHVFAGPLTEDLRLARASASDQDVRAALATVGALDWALALPDGLDTVVGDGGHRLTVAQAQQLALARLVLVDPPVAILDEATADAGSAGARELEAAAARALDGRTGLLVAHRLTQAAAADRVVVLEQGRVVESGTHADLVAAGGRYAALWSAWTGTRAESRTG